MAMNRWLAAPALALVLAACGGGSGGGSAAVVVPTGVRAGSASSGSDLTLANAGSFAGVMARAVMSGADDSVPGVSGTRESPQSRTMIAALSHARWTTLLAITSRTMVSGREQSQATSPPVALPCLSGSGSITVNDADNNQKLSAGDSASIVFNACVLEAGLPAVTGSISFTVNAIELDANEEPSALDASMTLGGFAESGFGSLSGAFRIWFKEETPTSTRQRVSYLAASLIEQAQTLTYDFDVYGVFGSAGGTFDLNGSIVIGGNTYAMSTPTLFSNAPGALPNVGALVLRDATGDQVILRARSATTFDLEFQAAGAATPTVVSPGLLWNSYKL
jgi:hypothetical protein